MRTKAQISVEIGKLQDNHCDPCRTRNKTGDKECRTCEIASQMKKLGDQLIKAPKKIDVQKLSQPFFIKKEQKPMTKQVEVKAEIQPITELTLEKINELQAQGKSIKAIGEAYGLSEKTAHYRIGKLKKAQVEKLGQVDVKKEYETVKQEVKDKVVASVDQNILKALEIKISELEQQVTDYPTLIATNDLLKIENERLQDEINKMFSTVQGYLYKLDEYRDKVVSGENVIRDKTAMVEGLIGAIKEKDQEIGQLELAKSSLEHANSTLQATVEDLFADLAGCKIEAQTSAQENERMNIVNRELKSNLEQHKAEAETAREYLKAVL